ncbi:hypothetical protein [Kaistia soli]|nr:hypothetical protein [Kaistia soli]
MTQIVLASLVQRQLWNAVRSSLRGRSGLIEVPVWSRESAPYAGGVWTPRLVPYDDGATFDDGGLHDNGPGVEIRMHASASIGATVVTLRLVLGSEQLSGIRFSYGGALYETGLALSVEGDLWEVPVFPAIRAVIPSDADLEIERPTCIMHLATDREMDVTFSRSQVDKPTVNFVEAVEYWADMAG